MKITTPDYRLRFVKRRAAQVNKLFFSEGKSHAAIAAHFCVPVAVIESITRNKSMRMSKRHGAEL